MSPDEVEQLKTHFSKELADYKQEMIGYIDERISNLGSVVVDSGGFIGSVSEIVGHTAKGLKRVEEYIALKESNTRKDYDLMAIKLRNILPGIKRGMDYNQVYDTFNLSSTRDAYTLMQKAANMFSSDLILHKRSGHREGKLIIQARSTL